MAMDSNRYRYLVRLTDWKLVLGFLFCLAPVLWQYGQTFAPAGWQDVAARVTYFYSSYRRSSRSFYRQHEVNYEYTVGGQSYKGKADSVLLCDYLSTDLNQKYNSGKTIIVSYNPENPAQSKATVVAADFTFSAVLTYSAAFLTGMIGLTLVSMSAMSGENLEREPKQYF
jgi:hypothetical protein